jgi:prepilin-type N-terminal cleavage/methylation domain-containing protein
MSSSSRPGPSAGFTLIEVLIALVLALIVGGVIFQVVKGQSQFVSAQTARQEVQQNARGALEILAGDLRAVPPQGLVSATATSITFLLPRAWGLSCGGGTTSTRYGIFPADLTTTMTSMGTTSGMLADTTGAAAWGPNPGAGVSWAHVDSVAAFSLSTAGGPCSTIRDPTMSQTAVQGLRIKGSSLPAATAGNTIFLYQYVKYDVAKVNNEEYWLRRTMGMTGTTPQQQPLAGPLVSDQGLTFTYYQGSGTTVLPAPAYATLASIGRIGISVSVRNRAKTGATQTETQTMTVLLRNR